MRLFMEFDTVDEVDNVRKGDHAEEQDLQGRVV